MRSHKSNAISSSSAQTGNAEKRIVAVDAARGCAMVLVCLSHIKHHFAVSAPELEWLLAVVTRVATPTFLLLSGFVISHLLRSDQSEKTRLMLVDRALFLIIVAHLLMGLAELPDRGFIDWYFGRSLITDAVAIALLAAVLVRGLSASVLVALGIALCLTSWIAATTLDVQSEAAKVMGAVLFDLRSSSNSLIDAPLVPYLGMFLLGMALNLRLQPLLAQTRHDSIAIRLFLVATTAILFALSGAVLWHFAKENIAQIVANPEVTNQLRSTLNPLLKRPPGPAYLLFYGGAGLLILAVCFARRPAALIDRLVPHAAVIGRASLMCFVVQDWIFHLAPRVFGYEVRTSVAFWLAYFAVAVLLLYSLARVWGHARGNRYLTIGLRGVMSRGREHPRPALLPPRYWPRRARPTRR
jgi:uncharacterized membrane protein